MNKSKVLGRILGLFLACSVAFGQGFPQGRPGGGGPCSNPALSTFGVIAANGGTHGFNCISSMDVFVDSTFNQGEPLQIDAAGVGAIYAQTSGGTQPAGEFNANGTPGTSGPFDILLDSTGASFPSGSIIAETTDSGNDNNIYAQMAYNPNDTICGGSTCTPGTGVTACILHPSISGAVNAGIITITTGTSTGGTLCTMSLQLQSYEGVPLVELFNENDGHAITSLQITCTAYPDQCVISAATVTASTAYIIDYHFMP